MQDVTTLGFIQLLGKYGAPDLLFTEYFRVHGNSTLEKHIVDSILYHETDKPIFAQLIGESIPDLERTVGTIFERELPVTGIDLNMGCPAPKVYKKNVGGGLLRDPAKIEDIFKCLKGAVQTFFTVKMRIGFESDQHFHEILDLINTYQVELLSLHARTVKGGYKSEVQYEYIKEAAKIANCPVLANGNITSYISSEKVIEGTQCRGVMIGRSCIRNPWIFRQIQEHLTGKSIFAPTFKDVRGYIEDLYQLSNKSKQEERFRINYLKKFLNFIGISIDNEGQFLYQARRCKTKGDLDIICDQYLIKDGNAEKIYPIEPISGLVARPNCEIKNTCSL
jgi:tRNA-dihydrouridine synthase